MGYNIALAAHKSGAKVSFCSSVADDLCGVAALDMVRQEGLPHQSISVEDHKQGHRTAQYIAVNDAKKELFTAFADMGILETPHFALKASWEQTIKSAARAPWLVVDANWSSATLSTWIDVAKRHGKSIAYEPVSTAKGIQIFSRTSPILKASDVFPDSRINLTTPNHYELAAMHTTARNNGYLESEEWWSIIDSFNLPRGGARDRLTAITNKHLVDQGIPQQSIQLLPFIPCIVTKLGPQGVLLTQILPAGDSRLTSPEYAPYVVGRASTDNEDVGALYMRLFPPAEIVPESAIVSVNGVGDTMLGVLIAGIAQGSAPIERLVPIAQEASVLTLKSKDAVSPEVASLKSRLSELQSIRP